MKGCRRTQHELWTLQIVHSRSANTIDVLLAAERRMTGRQSWAEPVRAAQRTWYASDGVWMRRWQRDVLEIGASLAPPRSMHSAQACVEW